MPGWRDRTRSFVIRTALFIGVVTAISFGDARNGDAGSVTEDSGGLLAFEDVTCTYDDPGETCVTSIWSVKVGGAAKPLARAPVGEAEDPSWSPDGRRIAFVGNLSEIWTTTPDRRGQKRLRAGGGLKNSPAWSPDGSRVAFGSDEGLFVMTARGGRLRALALVNVALGPVGMVRDVSWSPDGRRIAFADASGGIYVVRSDGRGLRWIGGGNLARRPWSPDGRRILLWLSGPGPLYVVNADGTGLRILARNGAQPDWSPDGRRIAFVRHAFGPDAEIVVMNASGTHRRRLADGMEPQWSPDGLRIAFSEGEGSLGAIHVMNADGTRQRTVAVDGHSPVWQPLRRRAAG